MKDWFLWSLFATIVWAIQSVSTYYFTNKKQYNATAVNSFSHLFGTIVIFTFILLNKEKKKIFSDVNRIYTNVPFIMLSSAIFMMLGNILLYMAYSFTPSNINAGIATGISELSIIFSTFLAYIFLKSKISFMQGGGIMLCFFSLWVATVGTTIVKKTKKIRKKEVGENTTVSNENISKEEAPIENNYKWFTYSILSAIFYSLGMFSTNLLTKKVKNINTVSISFLVPVIQLIIGIFLYISFHITYVSKSIGKAKYGLDNYVRDINSLFSEKTNILNGILNGLGEGGGIIALVKAYNSSPNGGIVDAISGGYSVLQAPLLKLIFDVPLKSNVVLGLIGQTIGSYLLLK